MTHKHQVQGFSLVELLLALVIGCGLTGGLLQAMLAEGSNGQRVGRLLRERVVARRTLELVRGDLLQAQGQADPAVLPPACQLSSLPSRGCMSAPTARVLLQTIKTRTLKHLNAIKAAATA